MAFVEIIVDQIVTVKAVYKSVGVVLNKLVSDNCSIWPEFGYVKLAVHPEERCQVVAPAAPKRAYVQNCA